MATTTNTPPNTPAPLSNDEAKEFLDGFRDANWSKRLLKKEEEVALGGIVQAGLSAQGNSGEEDMRSVYLGRAAEEIFVMANMRWVRKLADTFLRKGSSVPFEDLVSAGSIGLLVGCRAYDPNRGNRFLTMATWPVKKQIQVCEEFEGGSIRIPADAVVKIKAIRQATFRLRTDLGRPPTLDEIGVAVGLKTPRVAALMTGDEISAGVVSLTIVDREGAEEGKQRCVADPDAEDALFVVEAEFDSSGFSPEVRSMLGHVSARDREMILLRLGLGSGPDAGISYSTEELSLRFGLTVSHINRVMTNARGAMARSNPSLGLGRAA